MLSSFLTTPGIVVEYRHIFVMRVEHSCQLDWHILEHDILKTCMCVCVLILQGIYKFNSRTHQLSWIRKVNITNKNVVLNTAVRMHTISRCIKTIWETNSLHPFLHDRLGSYKCCGLLALPKEPTAGQSLVAIAANNVWSLIRGGGGGNQLVGVWLCLNKHYIYIYIQYIYYIINYYNIINGLWVRSFVFSCMEKR